MAPDTTQVLNGLLIRPCVCRFVWLVRTDPCQLQNVGGCSDILHHPVL